MPDLQHLRRHLRRFVAAHRRALAAICVGLAVFSALSSLEPEDEGVSVVVAARDIAAGHRLGDGDLRTVRAAAVTVPDGLLGGRDEVAGRTTATPLRRGEVVTDVRVLGSSLLEGYPAGTVLAAVRIDDPATLAGIRTGDTVHAIAVDTGAGDGSAQVVARDLTVVGVPDADDASADAGVVVHLAVAEDVAVRLSTAGASSRMALVGASATTLH